MADPFEEFEFKPLTEGLGFHKKADKIKSDMKSTMSAASPGVMAAEQSAPRSVALQAPTPRATEASRTASQSISELMASLPPSLDFLDDKQDLAQMPRPQIFQPIAREEYKSPIAAGASVSNALPAPGTKAGGMYSTAGAASSATAPTVGGAYYRDRMTDGFAKAFPTDQTKTKARTVLANEEGLVPIATNFSAGLIDAMVVAGISTILLVCIITITHINLIAMLTNASTDRSTQANLVFLFFAVLQMYMLVARAFFGASLGEWAFDLQLGTDAQHRQVAYPLMALWRMLVVTFTGVLALPLLSFAFGRDLSRYLSGLQLYRRV